MFDQLFHLLSSIHPVSQKFRNAIESELTVLTLPKNHVLLEAPKIADHIYFLNTGFAVSYRFTDGEKTIDGFWRSQEIVMPAQSFFERVPSLEFIQLMEKSEIYCLSYDSTMRLFSDFPEAHFIYRVVMNQYYEQSRSRFRDVQQLNTYQRLEKLLHLYPRIEQIVSQEYIASYLGITPQSLSRIKRRLTLPRKRGTGSPSR